MSDSWVTTTMVTPWSRLSATSVSMISCDVRVSRLPVGSSASSRLGELIRARAMATRCCWPPESWAGVLRSRSPRPSSSQRSARPFDARLAAHRSRRRVIEGKADIIDRAGPREEIEALEDEAEARAADAGEFRLLEPRDVDAVEEVPPAGRTIEAAQDRHQRRLARSRRAHDGDEFAALDRQADALERLHLRVADDERPRHVFDFENLFRHRRTFIGVRRAFRSAAEAFPIGRRSSRDPRRG